MCAVMVSFESTAQYYNSSTQIMLIIFYAFLLCYSILKCSYVLSISYALLNYSEPQKGEFLSTRTHQCLSNLFIFIFSLQPEACFPHLVIVFFLL